MRGDLHTLKKVCKYASTVMFIGEIVFAVLIIATIGLAIASQFSDGARDIFVDLISAKDYSDPLKTTSSFIVMTLIFALGFLTVWIVHDIMVSIQREHSPFMEDTPKGFKLVCMTFLILSVPMTILEYGSREDIVLAIGVLLLCILISVVMYCLTIIFRYGHLLQDESDHTL